MVVIIDIKECFVKVDFDLKKENFRIKSEPSFKGFKITKSDEGFKELEVNCPYDPDKEDCYLLHPAKITK